MMRTASWSCTHAKSTSTASSLNFLTALTKIEAKAYWLPLCSSVPTSPQSLWHLDERRPFHLALSFALTVKGAFAFGRKLWRGNERGLHFDHRPRLHQQVHLREEHAILEDLVQWPTGRIRLNSCSSTISQLCKQLDISCHELLEGGLLISLRGSLLNLMILSTQAMLTLKSMRLA